MSPSSDTVPDPVADSAPVSSTSPDSSGSVTTPNSTLPIIPQSLIDRILWPFSGTKPESPIHQRASLPPETFSDDLIVRVSASIEFAFHSAERLSDTSFAHTVALYCPLPLGNPFLDSMVKLVADQVDSDVVELDALELVAGSLGSPNENDLLRSLYSPVTPKELKKMEEFFTALISVPAKHGSARRRVLYLRDVGSIAMSAKPLMSILFRAVQNNRKQGGASTVVLFGVSAGLKTEKVDGRGGNKTFIASQDLLEAIPIMDPSSLLPSLAQVIRNPDRLAIDDLSPLGPAADNPSTSRSNPTRKGFFSLFFDSDEDDSEKDNLGTIWSTRDDSSDHSKATGPLYEALDATMCNSRVLIIEPNGSKGPNLQLLQQQALKSRVEAINRVVMRIIVRSNGARLSSDAEDFWVALVGAEDRSDDEHPRLSILPLSAARLVASIAIGLSSRANTSSEAPVLDADHISRAYQLSAIGNGHTTSCSKRKSVATIIAEITSKTGLTNKERMFISRIVQPEHLKRTGFLDVVIDPEVIKTLRSIISLPLQHPHQFSRGILAHESLSGILLYGPPGTGKTLVCRALAVEFGVPMLLVQSSDIFDKYLGESEKLAKAVFSLARRIAPCIVFIDEVDALFGSRKGGNTNARQDVHRAMLTEFMQEMDGIQTKGSNGVVVIGATNRPFDLDTAILRRLPRRMMVDLPSPEDREKILKLYLRSETCADDLDIHEIALSTEDFSGSDLKNLCVSAALEAVNDSILNSAVSSDTEGGPDTIRVIKQDHFTRALNLITPSFSYEANEELYQWHEEYARVGQSGMRMDDTYQEQAKGSETDILATFMKNMEAMRKEK